MKEALYYKKLKNNSVQCTLCPHFCVIKERNRGECKVRENKTGKLYSLVYSKPCSVAVDPVEKKPLFHFLPGSKTFSIGTAGCNLKCLFCQNYTTSQVEPEKVKSINLEPEKVVEQAIKNDCKTIAYTYNEPIVFYEYVIDTAKIAKKRGLKNIIVSNGYINEEPLKRLVMFIDGANIDLKGFSEEFYKEVGGELEPVLKSLKILKKKWLEITNLVIPGRNDDLKEIEKMSEWIMKNLGRGVPLHFSRFFPNYLMENISITPLETLKKAKEVAEKHLDYVYIGNISTLKDENTYCRKCKKIVIERIGFSIRKNELKKGVCECGSLVEGVWK